MSSQSRRPRRPAAIATAAAILAATLALPAAPVLGLTIPTCAVRNVDRDTTFAALQPALDDAATVAGDHLTVKGPCSGDATIDIDLSIRGVRAKGGPAPSLVGTGTASVLTIVPGVRVSIAALAITGGDAADGGGIYNEGTLTLAGVRVYENHAAAGGGGISSRGRLTLTGRTSIDHNSAAFAGGGIDVIGEARASRLTMKGRSSIHDNVAGEWGGAISAYTVGFAVAVTLTGRASLHHDSAPTGAAYLGEGALTMRDSSRIHHETATDPAGGIVEVVRYAGPTSAGTLTMAATARITANSAGASGAAVIAHTACGAIPILVGVASRVTGNSPSNILTLADCP